MNGITAAQFGDFTKNWNLVTVRYRKDTGEMRWTYANELAWKSLRENKTSFPDGAMFAKVGVMTKEDPAFPSSAVPSGARRMQFMVKNNRKFSSTEGWGYAIFDADGKKFPGDEAQAIAACAACHRLVPQRGYVFSQLLGGALGTGESWRKQLAFMKRKSVELPAMVRKVLPLGAESIWVITGELRDHVFPGTLDEITPVLAKEALSTGLPAALVDRSEGLFSLVFPMKERGACSAAETRMKSIHSVADPKAPLFEKEFCQAEK